MDSLALDRVFSALSDATRRGILAELSGGPRNVRQLTSAFEISQPAISKHLRVLDTAGLIRREKRGREHLVTVNAAAAEEAAAWIAHYARFWRLHFDAVDDILTQRKEAQDDN